MCTYNIIHVYMYMYRLYMYTCRCSLVPRLSNYCAVLRGRASTIIREPGNEANVYVDAHTYNSI